MQSVTLHKTSSFTAICKLLEKGNYAGVLDIVTDAKISLADVESYVFWDADNYTRNCIARTENYELLLLCWEKGQASAIHGHNEQECWVKVIEGNFEEIVYLYDEVDKNMAVLEHRKLADTDISHLSENTLFHSLRNAKNGRSVSLHLYIKPINNCKVFNKQTGNFANFKTTYYSVAGKKV